MACKTSFELHHHFPKLAEESGFTFNTHRPRIHIDWNKIRLIDIDSLIKDRKFVIIEQHLNDILDCVIESEFDVRILDEGVMKLFRLAQLAVEYQQFCRHYLDRSVYVLREEITSLAQELDTCKKDLRDRDEEIRRLRKRSRHNFKNPLPYGNDNIATMILKTLSHKGDMFPTTSNDALQYNKCNYCDKVFLNQLYLRSHIARRHSNVMEAPQKDKQEIATNNENSMLSAEVNELKNKLREMELVIASTKNQSNPTIEIKSKTDDTVKDNKKDMKDAEVSTNNEDYLLNKIEEWKKEEHENYNKEMDKLRSQIIESIKNIKEKEIQNSLPTEPKIIIELHETIKQQGAEILALKKELNDARIRTEKDKADRNKETEAQILLWSNRAEAQSRQYELLLQKLNDVAKDARESRALAEAERERAGQLQILLQQNINPKTNGDIDSTDDAPTPSKKSNYSDTRKKPMKKKTNTNKPDQEVERKTLEQLHRKAQELLNTGSMTSSSSDTSSEVIEKPLQTKSLDIKGSINNNNNKSNRVKKVEEKHQQKSNGRDVQVLHEKTTPKRKAEVKKEKLKSNHIKTSKEVTLPEKLPIPGSPMKVIRAKITEEVNSRLVSAGVDPLKHRLPRSVFQKQRLQIHQHQELKAKKNSAHEKVRHTILAYLDASTTDLKKEVSQIQDYVSPTKTTKPFKHFTSVISNVKTKALSLVKMNDTTAKDKRKSLNAEVAKRAMSLLKTPPGSASNSPVAVKRSPIKTFTTTQNVSTKALNTNVPDDETSVKNSMNNSPKIVKNITTTNYSDVDSDGSDHKYYNTTKVQQTSKSIENLIKSPARRPSSAAADYNHSLVKKYTISDDHLLRTQSTTSLIERSLNSNGSKNNTPARNNENSSDDAESLLELPVKKNQLGNNADNIIKQTKSVLKNASSTSSLNKKKVLFDMDAIQMKSVSASPSQSITEKSDGNEKYELGLVNLDADEWDISSIENEPLKNDTKIQNVTTHTTSPKIAELKLKIESQLARRNDTPTAPLVGAVDVLAGSMAKASSLAGSNTSLGSSILDDSESVSNQKTLVKPKPVRVAAKEESDIDISEFSMDGIVNKNESF
ncbi:zinc finger protein DZIP1L [Spodoptera litura]|uniref:Zinc finger protein DZIP1L n=1 Tax=Spodoptera litura TaxID=69820 RepID=A0A9J7EJH6_SPOLT|nr:zinc finger protein DZIP1L [Spodoptera litura]